MYFLQPCGLPVRYGRTVNLVVTIRGFPKVHLGNVLAFVALCLLFVALKQKKIGLGEQPRRSKMRWLLEWKRLVALGAVECVVASCAYGSPHQKEFGLIGANIVLDGIARRCTRDHVHIPIQGRYTKPSAVYCPALAVAFAELFQQHIIDYDLQQRSEDFDISGLESILANDVSVGLSWKQTASWKWTRSSHINVLEGKAALRLFTRVASSGGDVRLPFLCDSHVARSAIAKGRFSIRCPSVPFEDRLCNLRWLWTLPCRSLSPTRYNPGDAPTRDLPMPIPFSNMLCAEASPLQLRALAMMRGLRRWICGWIRLVLLLCPGVLDFLCDSSSSWRRHPAFVYRPGGRRIDFDSTLGYPGEGHPLSLVLWIFYSAVLGCIPCCSIISLSWICSFILHHHFM